MSLKALLELLPGRFSWLDHSWLDARDEEGALGADGAVVPVREVPCEKNDVRAVVDEGERPGLPRGPGMPDGDAPRYI